jgi:hypothetical protein
MQITVLNLAGHGYNLAAKVVESPFSNVAAVEVSESQFAEACKHLGLGSYRRSKDFQLEIPKRLHVMTSEKGEFAWQRVVLIVKASHKVSMVVKLDVG